MRGHPKTAGGGRSGVSDWATARRTLLITALALTIIGSTVATAQATFPGKNGPIAYRTFDFNTGFGVPLFRAQPDGTQITELSQLPGFFTDWRADGRRIAFDFFEEDFDEQIATMRPNGTRVRVLTSGPGIHEVPSWSPNGRRIVFDFSPEPDPNTPGFHTRLWRMRADGSHQRPLPMSKKGFDVEPKYSPNGNRIAFGRLRITDEDFQQAIFVVKTKGNHRVRRLTPWELSSEHPTWSPDGRWIIFNNAPDGTIQVMRPNGRKRHTIVPASVGFGGHKPWFSPNGKRILFMCENQGTLLDPPPDYNEDICTMKTDGSEIVHVIDTPDTLENWPSWGPTRRRR
jgi:Tol biopolymer transport system component